MANVIPNQVFVGCPWKNIRKKYVKVSDKLGQKYPQSFILIGREEAQSAEDLLKEIKEKLFSSSYAIFDVTGGNANVSLEFGYAESEGIERALYLNVRESQNQSFKKDSAIISDLAGKRRNHYKTEKTLQNLLEAFCKAHPYTKRFEKTIKQAFSRKSKGTKKSYRTLSLKAIHFLDNKTIVRRDDLTQQLQGDGYKTRDIENVLKALHKSGLIRISRGKYADVEIN